MKENIEKAVGVLNSGGIIIFPTDTAFGIGCRADNEHAIRRLYEIRKRPQGMPVPLLVSSKKMAGEYFMEITPAINSLMEKYWPGGLTIIYFCKKGKISQQVLGKENTVGLRMPASDLCINLINKCSIPIVGTSANFHGDNTPFEPKDLNTELVKSVDFVLNGNAGGESKTSTILDCTNRPWKILREGAVKISELN